MTQPPQFDYYQPASSYPDTLAPARRASLLLFILGTLLAGFGLCNILSTANLSSQELQEAQMRFMPKDQAPPFKLETLKTISVVVQGLIVVIGLVLLALGVPVRGGSYSATLSACIVTGIVLALVAVLMLMMLIAAIAAPVAGVFVCFMVVPLVAFAVQFWWLIQAARASAGRRTSTQQYAANYWQYYQQQTQAGYGPYAPPGAAAAYPQYPAPSQPPSPQQPPTAAPENPYGNPPPQ